jgi:hypothetical protein
MPASFCYDRRNTYFDNQDVLADTRYAMMRHAGTPDLGDKYERYSRVERPKFRQRTRLWGLFGVAKPKNSEPRRKEHRA